MQNARWFDACEPHVEPLMFDAELFVLNSQHVQHCGMKVANVNNVFH